MTQFLNSTQQYLLYTSNCRITSIGADKQPSHGKRNSITYEGKYTKKSFTTTPRGPVQHPELLAYLGGIAYLSSRRRNLEESLRGKNTETVLPFWIEAFSKSSGV
eukprot:CAMPEP_0184739996 /NCGR_PEP_ID=MMETSP0315-20130426/2948_1 /TAXON_ID=101924 /ORGANISM="Rhodosorus marinus, Strain UTEX LB 2760" /LENGTH=104 /DNA_ID=CAMNT_0027209321 /DNA_START=242 /DNA_END=552 /DNA_ORIENTATION=-